MSPPCREIAASVGVELKHALLAQGGRPLPTDLQVSVSANMG